MDTITIGRMVHYVMPSGEHRPAVVVRVWEVETSPGMVNLVVFVDGYNDDESPNTTLWKTSVQPDLSGQAQGTWHWPER